MPIIDYESESFPPGGPVTNGPAQQINVSWNDIVWAALTVGRPNRNAVFQYGNSSFYEAIFRLSLVRMALEQLGPGARRLRRTSAARALDPTEKGAVNYFIGMLMCKLFADKLLDAPWMLHLDVFRPALNVVLSSRSRPDLIGQRISGEWVALESKGRISAPDTNAKTRAKQQAQRVVSVSGTVPQFHIGAITYLKGEALQFYWRDPEPPRHDRASLDYLEFNPDMWRYHYELVLAYIQAGPRGLRFVGQPETEENEDVTVKIHPEVFDRLQLSQWAEAKEWCVNHHDTLTADDFRSDGTRVIAGESWLMPFEEGI